MRVVMLIAGAALALAACNRDGAGDNAVATGGDDLSANAISTNDTTAIDAATGDDANMAADTDLTFNEMDANGLDNAAESPAIAASNTTTSHRAKPAPNKTIDNPANAASNATANNAT
jgi:hypothetical protein